MHILLKTHVNQAIAEVWQGFNRVLFNRLSPPFPPVDVIRFDGCMEGDVVHLRLNFLLFRQDWISLIVDQQTTENEIYFVDQGTRLPFFLVYMQAVANYSWLNWMDGRRMLMPRTLKYYMPKLPTEWFIRLHRNCVVNRRYVERLERTETGGLVHLTTGDVLPVSRRRWTSVRRQLINNMPHLN